MSNWLKNLFSSKQTAIVDHPNDLSKKLPTQAALDEQSVMYKEQGDAHLRQGKLEDATVCYRQAIALNPTYAKAYSNLGLVLKNLGHYGEAEHCLNTALSIDPEIAQAHYLLGTIAQVQDRPEETVSHFQKALEIAPDFENVYSELCYALFQQGKITNAIQVITQGISINRDNPDFHYYRGNLYKHTGAFDQAVVDYRTALSIRPAYAEVHYSLGVALHALGRLDEAEVGYRRTLEIKSDYFEAHHNLGSLLQDLGRLDEAELSYRMALEINPDSAEAHNNLGNILLERNRLDEAELSCRRALAIKPDFAEAHNNLGNLLKELNRSDEAELSYRRALAIKPDFAEVLCNLGVTLNDFGQLDEAESSFRQALRIKPDYADANNNLALVLTELRRIDEALISFRAALELKPDFAEAHNNLGSTLMEQGRLAEAEVCLSRALEINPDYAYAYNNLGNFLQKCGRLEQALPYFRRALQIKPDYAEAHSNLIFSQDLMVGKDAASLLEERVRWDATHAAHLHQQLTHANSPDPERRIRIGYVSADFREHSASKAFGGLLTHYDRSQFEVFAYSNFRGKDDKFTELFKQSVTTWRSVVGLSDAAAAKMISDDGIDILVDLSGHSANNRLLTFAHKPAPIQVTAWGYAGGTGMRTMDVLFTDSVMVPPENRHYFVEEIRYLPNALGAFFIEPFPDATELPALSSGIVTFGSLNRLVKVSDETYRAWTQILLAIPDSRLVLKTAELNDISTQERVVEYFTSAGVAADRITLQGKTSWYEHMLAYRQIDIGLDPFPQGGGVTALEGLMMGVPIINLLGSTVAGRLSASIVTTLGLSDWIAKTREQYIELAIQKATDLQSLATLRQQLRGIFSSSIIGDQAAYAQAVELEYRQLWRQWCNKAGNRVPDQ